MAHKTLIGGTAYEIKGGKTLIDGTAYSIKNGKTLVGGTVYEVGFAPPLTVAITHNNLKGVSGVSASIGYGEGYISEPGTYQVPAGTEMHAYVRYENTDDLSTTIQWNGTSVGSGSWYRPSGRTPAHTTTYDFTLTNDITCYFDFYGKGRPTIYIEDV
jgi:hypothetical protein